MPVKKGDDLWLGSIANVNNSGDNEGLCWVPTDKI